ncbi:hypothetical protein HPB47_004297 [Ixodes persulcatus]|uniref:Uncharacterized protein n=1 Tax=Ixodes persulcatus TaxID=34615 RepID=A0AC60PGX1_IXOPE|nr:hypothetical protein HPB47_004297 [Ixodes persulcatus]
MEKVHSHINVVVRKETSELDARGPHIKIFHRPVLVPISELPTFAPAQETPQFEVPLQDPRKDAERLETNGNSAIYAEIRTTPRKKGFLDPPTVTISMKGHINVPSPHIKILGMTFQADRVCGENQVTCSELLKKLKQYAAGFQRHGVEPGDKVLAHLGDLVESFIAMYAIVLAGGIVIPSDPASDKGGGQQIRYPVDYSTLKISDGDALRLEE